MGTSLSRQNAAVEEADVTLNHPYKYPPKTGKYEAKKDASFSHFQIIFFDCVVYVNVAKYHSMHRGQFYQQ